jgi:hypothetical protein
MMDGCRFYKQRDAAANHIAAGRLHNCLRMAWYRNHELGAVLMPRYHFDTECGDLRYEDPDGIDLNSIEQAQQQLLGLLRDLTLFDDVAGASKLVTAHVKCEGNVVLQGSCSLVIIRPDA